MFLCWRRLLDRIIDNEVQEKIIATQCATDFAAPLQMDEQFLVHELNTILALQRKDKITERTFLSSGCDAFDMVERRRSALCLVWQQTLVLLL